MENKEVQNVNETPAAMPNVANEEHSISKGVIIGVLAIGLVFILGGLYLWGRSMGTVPAQPLPPNTEPETVRAQADVEMLKTVSSSDEIGAIEADLDSTILDSLDAELDQIDATLR